jgi:inorganic pyrophosphatase
MHYPCNYGYVPQTLSDDGDPCDVLVLSPMPLVTGVVVRCRPIGMLKLDDEAGGDAKILAVPIDKLSSLYHHVKSPRDLPEITTRQIAHFFEHYKDLEPGKWVRVGIWVEAEEAKREIVESIARFQRAQRGAAKPSAAAPKAETKGKSGHKDKAKAKAKGEGKARGNGKSKAKG